MWQMETGVPPPSPAHRAAGAERGRKACSPWQSLPFMAPFRFQALGSLPSADYSWPMKVRSGDMGPLLGWPRHNSLVSLSRAKGHEMPGCQPAPLSN